MTYEEALTILYKGIAPNPTANNECIELCKKALEKQIPKKPEYEAWGYADGVLAYDYAKCPVCGHDFEDGVNDWGCAYCKDCGYALDWSDTE